MHIALMILQAATTPAELGTWASLGVGGVLAGVMFYFYRQDRKAAEERYSEDRKTSEERYQQIIRDFRGIIEANTAAMASLKTTIEAGEK